MNKSKQKIVSGTAVSDFGAGFILLSKIAKEKKYAQEYLGLLARRGDIGSIRIGKRWYTTWQWFEEFLENGQKKKEMIDEVQVLEMGKVQLEMMQPEKMQPAEEKTIIPVQLPEEEKIKVIPQNKMVVQSEEDSFEIKVDVPQIQKIHPIPPKSDSGSGERLVVRNVAQKSEAAFPIQVKRAALWPNIQIAKKVERRIEKNKIPVSVSQRNEVEKEIIPIAAETKKDPILVSPDLLNRETPRQSMMATFAFSASFAIIFLLLMVSAYFVFSENLFRGGRVAGVSDERNGGLAGIKSEGSYYLDSTGSKIKESFSISSVVIEAVKKRGQ